MLTPHQHLRTLTGELAAEGSIVGTTTKGRWLLTLVQSHISNILTPPPPLPATATKQRVEQRVSMEQQRVIKDTPIITLPCITNAPAIMKSCNPMAKQAIKTAPLVHQQVMLNNTPGGVPLIQRAKKHMAIENNNATPDVATWTRSTIPMAQTRLISQQVLTAVTI
jgi:hypothetical protein